MKFSKLLLTFWLVFTTACSPAFASFYIPDSSVTTAKIKNLAVTRAKLASGAKSNLLRVTAAAGTTLDTTATDVLEMTCSAACTVTLPTAVGIEGYEVTIIHRGTQLVPITLHTNSSQTVGGIADNVYKLYTTNERLTIYSDNVNWQIRSHQAETGWVSAGSFIDYYTFTTSTASATIAATYAPTYVFTITAGNTASVGAIYSNNGNQYTLRQALLIAETSVIVSGAAAPLASGTLTYVSGTHTGGNITFSSVAGNINTSPVFTVNKTLASGTTLITDTKSATTFNSTGKLYKVSGTGDAVITYSAVAGNYNRTNTTTGATAAIYYGDPVTNSRRWRRKGHFVTFEDKYYQAVGGPTSASNDAVFSIVSGFSIDLTDAPIFTTGSGDIGYTAAGHDSAYRGFAWGDSARTGSDACDVKSVTPYSATQVRIWCLQAAGGWMINLGGASAFTGVNVTNLNVQYELPIDGFQP